MSPPKRVGFVGLGRMGWPMAHNLAGAGFELVVHDADAERAARFADVHAEACAAQAPGAFADVEVVVTMLPDDRVVREAILNWEGGIAAALPTGAVVVDMSSSNPRGTRSLGEELAKRELGLVDAPVSGGVPRAESGTLAIMVGGDDADALARAEPVLRALGDRLFNTGRLGTGHAMKALNNFLGAAAYAAAAEAVAIGTEFDLSAATTIDVVNASTGRSFTSEHVFAEHVITGRYGTGFALGLLAKDAGIAADLARSIGLDAPVCELVARRWSEAQDGLGSAADHSEAHKQWFGANDGAGERS